MLPPSGKWSVQPPPWAALDFDNPLLKDVQHVATGSAPFLNRGEYNDSFRTSATPPVPVRQPTGISYNLTGSTGYLATNAGGWVNAKTDWTVYVLGIPRSVTVNSSIAVVAEAPGSGTRDRSIQINSLGKVIGGGYDTGNRQVISTSSLTANVPASAAVRGTSSALSVFVNGLNDATPVTMTAAGFGSYTSPEVIFGYGGSAAGFAATLASQFDLSLGIYWSRALTDAEILSLHQNPWQVFKSPRRFIVPESGAVAYSLDTTPGSYALTGSSATTLYDRLVDTTAGSYSLTGSSATTLYDRLVDTTAGSYSLTGSSATTLYDRLVDTTAGSYTLTGVSATLDVVAALTLDTTPGSYTLTGSSATLEYVAALELDTTPGSYTLTGSSATTLYNRLVDTTAGSYSLTGSSATALYGRLIDTTAGSYTLTGSSATTLYNRLVDTTPGIYSLTGSPAELIASAGVSVNVTGVSGTGNVGTVSVAISINALVTGIAGISSIGAVTVSVTSNPDVNVTGVVATGYVGSPLVWGPVDDGQTPNWVIVDDSHSASWTQVLT
jgi:hypothetical protein